MAMYNLHTPLLQKPVYVKNPYVDKSFYTLVSCGATFIGYFCFILGAKNQEKFACSVYVHSICINWLDVHSLVAVKLLAFCQKTGFAFCKNAGLKIYACSKALML